MTCTLLKLLLLYYVATHLSQRDFVGYHLYVYYTDILVTLGSAGTISYLAAQSEVPLSRRLAIAFRTENIAMCILLALLGVVSAVGAFTMKADTSFWFVLALAVGRLNTQLFSRYYLFNGQFARSLLNDLASNLLWAVPLNILLLSGRELPLRGVVALWIGFLLVNTGYNLTTFIGTLRTRVVVWDIRAYLRTVARSFALTSIVNNYFGVEKLLFLGKFQIDELFSSYIFMSRVVGMVSEFTVNFLSSLTNARLSQVIDRRGAYFRIGIVLAAAIYLGILAVLPVAIPFIQSYFPDKLDSKYLWLSTYVVVQAFLYYSVALNTIYFQRFSLYTYRTVTALCMLAGLGVLYLVDVPPQMFLIGQITLFTAIVAADLLQQRMTP